MGGLTWLCEISEQPEGTYGRGIHAEFTTSFWHVRQGAAAVMRVVLRLVHPSNVDVEIELLDAEVTTLDTLIRTLLQKGYLQRREKQGDEWWSHKVITGHGEELYCRGYRHGNAASDGFLVCG